MQRISAFAETAALMGDPARANMLFALMDGRALTAGELARFCRRDAADCGAAIFAELPEAGCSNPPRRAAIAISASPRPRLRGWSRA